MPAPRREIQPIALETLAPPEDLESVLAPWGEQSVQIAAKLMEYLKNLLETNQLFNLTGDTAPEKQWRGHIEDALMNAATLARMSGGSIATARIADVGSGGGMPGIVWAIVWPQARVVLVESTGKKAEFLADCAKRLGLENVDVICERAEVIGQLPKFRESFDWVTARALAETRVAAEWTAPLCKIGGYLALIKGSVVDDEIRSARRAMRTLGLQPDPKIEAYARSDGKECRLLIYRKTERTPSPYPRRVGVATQNPL